MAQLKIRDLYNLLSQAPRRRDLEQDGIRLVYDGTAVNLSTADAPGTVIGRASTCGFVTGSWDVTAHKASLDTVMAWMRMLDGEDLIDVAPFWASAPVVLAFATGGQVGAWPVIACPTAPADRRPGAVGEGRAER
ncbi:hypothetical protein PV332_14400 [Streptomyces scabiei]|uniref:hypothetical protein n=1 Tax=Streptomyces TaxID=1883 RepID=UPI00190BEAD1|nr:MULTISPECIES: hypothetical protein [Streptomyces]MBK3645699.1 hypothetical protein [Streptomyces sp. MBT33]MDX2576660.1 hypothetical protein [Streptomyces scabiei]MDX3027658.1 hypothetical protein [Streptomyces scabiei]MDX3206325.1 hypothetical protein [Streptomyces scabiei]